MAHIPTLDELFALNDELQKSRAVRLLAAKNLAPYITLMERHLDHSAKVAEPELVLRLEQDLGGVGMGDQSGLGPDQELGKRRMAESRIRWYWASRTERLLADRGCAQRTGIPATPASR